jgi:hypothetical protein
VNKVSLVSLVTSRCVDLRGTYLAQYAIKRASSLLQEAVANWLVCELVEEYRQSCPRSFFLTLDCSGRNAEFLPLGDAFQHPLSTIFVPNFINPNRPFICLCSTTFSLQSPCRDYSCNVVVLRQDSSANQHTSFSALHLGGKLSRHAGATLARC